MNGYPVGSKAANSSRWFISIRSVVSVITIVPSFVQLLFIKLSRGVNSRERDNTRKGRVLTRVLLRAPIDLFQAKASRDRLGLVRKVSQQLWRAGGFEPVKIGRAHG